MDSDPHVPLEAPRFEHIDQLLVAGKTERYARGAIAGIPAQWRRFDPYIGSIPGQTGYATFGVCFNGDEAGAFDYLCGVEVTNFDELGDAFDRVRIADQQFAVFHRREHISTMFRTVSAIWSTWLPASEFEAAKSPWFERYGPEFDGGTGLGGYELWIPVTGSARV